MLNCSWCTNRDVVSFSSLALHLQHSLLRLIDGLFFTATNPCTSDHGCKQVCFIGNDNQPTCTCNANYELESDGKTCKGTWKLYFYKVIVLGSCCITFLQMRCTRWRKLKTWSRANIAFSIFCYFLWACFTQRSLALRLCHMADWVRRLTTADVL